MSGATTPMPGPVVVVGGGAAAASVVARLARADRTDVAVLTAEDRPPYDRTMLSKAVLSGAAGEATRLYEDQLDAIDVRTGATVTAIDREGRSVSLADGTSVPYGTLVIATGARARSLPLPGTELPGVHTLRSAADADALVHDAADVDEVVVIGGGLIGLEAAAALRERDLDVVVVEAADRLLGRVLPPALAAIVAAAHREAGTRLEIGVRPTAITAGDDGRVAAVELDDGRTLRAGLVLVAIGVTPVTELAQGAGLACDDGILVDERLVTDDPAVLAVGDAVRVAGPDGDHRPRTEAWTPALSMGQHAARTILGEDAPYADVPWMWSDQLDLQVQAVGAPVAGLEQVTRGTVTEDGQLVLGLDADGRVVGACGVSRGRGIARAIRGARELVEAGVVVDRATLADPTADLRRLARSG